jgi:hypothetical protein
MWCVTIDGVWIGEWNHWPIMSHDSVLQGITAPPLISTIHKSPQQPLSLFSACSVFTRRSLATTSNSRNSSGSRAHVPPSPTPVQNCLPTIPSGTRLTLFIAFRHEPHRKHRFHCYSPTIHRLLLAYSLHCLVTAIHATLLYVIVISLVKNYNFASRPGWNIN